MRDSRFISCKRLTFSCLHVSLAVSWLRLLLRCCVNMAVRRLARLCQSLRNIPFRLAEQPVLNGKTWRSALRRGAFGPVQPAFQRFPAVSVSVSFGAGGAVFQEISRHRADCAGPCIVLRCVASAVSGCPLCSVLSACQSNFPPDTARFQYFSLSLPMPIAAWRVCPSPFRAGKGCACGCLRMIC